MRFWPVPFVIALAACGPLSPERAADICEERARLAAGPKGEIGVGINNKGETLGKFELEVTSDYLQGRDPYLVYDRCVRQKSGQGPIRPLVLN